MYFEVYSEFQKELFQEIADDIKMIQKEGISRAASAALPELRSVVEINMINENY